MKINQNKPELDNLENGKFSGIIKGKPKNDNEQQNIDFDFNKEIKIPDKDLDLENPEISIYTEMKPIITLKDEFGKDVNDNIHINIHKNELYPNEININIPNNKDTSIKDSNNIEIDLPNINTPDIKLKGNNQNINIQTKIPSINSDIKESIPELDLDLNKSKKKFNLNPSLNLKEIFNEDIETPIKLSIKKHILEPDNNYINIPDNKLKKESKNKDKNNKAPKLNKSVNNFTTGKKITKYETIEGEIPGKNNLSKSRFELISGEITGISNTGRKTEVSNKNKEKKLKDNFDIKRKKTKFK